MSVTAVPLRPIPKRALILLWIGIAVLVIGGAAFAWRGASDPAAVFLAENGRKPGVVTTASGLQYQVLNPGQGAKPTDADIALIGYKGTFLDGAQFDANPQTPMPVAGVVPGFSEGLKLMSKGARYRFWLPPELGYGGPRPAGAPPLEGEMVKMASSVLVFEVDLQDFLPEAVVRQMQQQMQQGGMPGGMPGGAMPGAAPPTAP